MENNATQLQSLLDAKAIHKTNNTATKPAYVHFVNSGPPRTKLIKLLDRAK